MKRRPIAWLPPEVRRAIRVHAREEAPRECCGLLVGVGRRVHACLPLANIDPAPRTRFRLDARDHFEAMRWLRQLRPPLSIVGVYHSHPGGSPTPSESDLAEAHYPEWLYVIAAPSGARVRLAAFEIRGGRARQVTLRAGGRPLGTNGKAP